MKFKKLKILALLTTVIVPFSISSLSASDAVEWTLLKTLKLEAAPLDVAVSADGSRIFVLTEQGKIIVYTANAEEEATIDVGDHVDKIQVGPRGDIIFSNSRKNKSVQIFAVDFIQIIDVSNSPFKGPADAPIVIAVFDDFQ
ncbi:MAG: hypothetical protein JSW26_21525 [Desulfobacterales bacterium]|nr:MAG: hypothetical protein JSW26_21525 [Desulfobacterales bacterium]